MKNNLWQFKYINVVKLPEKPQRKITREEEGTIKNYKSDGQKQMIIVSVFNCILIIILSTTGINLTNKKVKAGMA